MKRRLVRAGIVLAVLGLGLAGANWAAGRYLPAPSLLFRPDPDLVFASIPGARRVLAVDPDAHATVATEIDARGFRGGGIAPKKRGYRVAVYGDSLVMAETTPLEETFVERLGAHLRSSGREVEVVNAGVTGYGPDQECLRLEREIDALAPDLVVLVLCAHNDFGDLVRNKLFRLDEAGKLVANRWSLHPDLAADFAAKERDARRPALLRVLDGIRERKAERERLAAAHGRKPPYVEWYLLASKDEYSELVLEKDNRVRSVFADYYDADVAIRPEAPSAVLKVRMMGAVLERLAGDCKERSIPLFAVVVPSAVDTCPEFEIRVDPAEWPTWDKDRLCRTLDGILERLSVAHLDLTRAFLDAGACGLFGTTGDFHWNAKGQELAALQVAESLAAK